MNFLFDILSLVTQSVCSEFYSDFINTDHRSPIGTLAKAQRLAEKFTDGFVLDNKKSGDFSGQSSA